jgi:hypothetical protein
MVPVTTMEEIPILSGRERDELLTSLEQAEQRIHDGEGVDYDPKTFKQRLTRVFRETKRSRK